MSLEIVHREVFRTAQGMRRRSHKNIPQFQLDGRQISPIIREHDRVCAGENTLLSNESDNRRISRRRSGQ